MHMLGTLGIFFAGLGVFFIGIAVLWWCSIYFENKKTSQKGKE